MIISEVTAINSRQKFLAELGKLLTFMYEEDRQLALSMYEQMFDCAEDEDTLIHELMSPTRQAVLVARAYDAKERKLSVSSTTKKEEGYEGNGETPEFVHVIQDLFDKLVGDVRPESDVMENQVSLFEESEEEAPEEEVPTEDDAPAEEPEEVPKTEEIPEEEESAEEDIPDQAKAEETAEEAVEESEQEDTSDSRDSTEADEAEEPMDDFQVAEEAEEAMQEAVAEAAAEEVLEEAAEEAPAEEPEEPAAEEVPVEEVSEEETPAEPEEAPAEESIQPVEKAVVDEAVRAVPEGPVRMVRKPKVFLLFLFILLAIPITLVLVALLLVPTVACLAAAVGLIALGAMLIVGAFSGFPVFADILLMLGAAIVVLALGLLFLWLFIWFIAGAIVGLIRGVVELGSNWCYKEVPER